MGLRYRRMIVLAEGLRLDLSKSGLGVTMADGPTPPEIGAGVRPTLDLDGTVTLHDADGVPLSPSTVREIRREYDAVIRQWLAELCERWNRRNDDVVNIHHQTPPPDAPLDFQARPFDEPRPEPYTPPDPTLLDRSWPPQRKKFEAEVAALKQAYEEELWRWRRRRMAHEAREEQRRKDLEIGRYGDRIIMETFLAEYLTSIEWPAETTLAFEISLDTTTVFLDLRLPEIELIPAREARPAARGLRIRYTELSSAQIRRAYASHLHAVIFRLTGEIFRALPAVERVIASGFIDRPNEIAPGVTAGPEPGFLVSAEFDREGWERIDLSILPALDPIAIFERFRLRRRLTRHGVFTRIEPLGKVEIGGLFDLTRTEAR